LVGRAGSQPINQLNHALLAKLSADKLLRARKPDPAAGAHDAGYLGITLERLGRKRRFLLGRDGVEVS
jgi:hypothetical protein